MDNKNNSSSETNNVLKNLVLLSSINDVNIFKYKDSWILKDKRKLIKECENKKKKKINEVCNSLKSLTNNNSSQIKIINDNLINDIQKIDSLIETIEKNDIDPKSLHFTLAKSKLKIHLPESCEYLNKSKKYIEIFSN
jgi:hypothetical protein